MVAKDPVCRMNRINDKYCENYDGLGAIWASLFTDVKSFMRVRVTS